MPERSDTHRVRNETSALAREFEGVAFLGFAAGTAAREVERAITAGVIGMEAPIKRSMEGERTGKSGGIRAGGKSGTGCEHEGENSAKNTGAHGSM